MKGDKEKLLQQVDSDRERGLIHRYMYMIYVLYAIYSPVIIFHCAWLERNGRESKEEAKRAPIDRCNIDCSNVKEGGGHTLNIYSSFSLHAHAHG